jgi:hypothetical protein
MKSVPTLILLYGHDETLLETRQWVLQSRGYRVVTTLHRAGIESIPQFPAVKLLLLCHSLTPLDRQAAIAVAASRWPEVQSVVLHAENTRTPTGILGQLLHTMDGPSGLVSLVERLVGSNTTRTGTAA